MELTEAIYTQRAIRRFRADPVPDELIRQVLEAASKAPSGSNTQPWVFLILKDPEVKRVVAEFRRRGGEELARLRTRELDPATAQLHHDAEHLRDHMAEVPVLILACIRHDEFNPPTVVTSPGTLTRGASIYPAVQNLMLAARALGLGTVPTVMHKLYEDEVKAFLGIPANVETAALIPMGYPAEGVSFGATSRHPVEDIAFLDGWGTPFF